MIPALRVVTVCLILCAGCKPWGPQFKPTGRQAINEPVRYKPRSCSYMMVYVYTAKTHAPTPVYADPNMTTFMTNPFFSNCDGSYKFWAKPNIEVSAETMEFTP